VRERGRKCRVGSFGGSLAISMDCIHVLGHISQTEKPSPPQSTAQSSPFASQHYFTSIFIRSPVSLIGFFFAVIFTLLRHYAVRSPEHQHIHRTTKSVLYIVCCLVHPSCHLCRLPPAVPVNKEKFPLHFQPHCIPNANRFVIHG